MGVGWRWDGGGVEVGWGRGWEQGYGGLMEGNSFLLLRKKPRIFTVPLTAHELICESI